MRKHLPLFLSAMLLAASQGFPQDKTVRSILETDRPDNRTMARPAAAAAAISYGIANPSHILFREGLYKEEEEQQK